jgi:hypothetical protein
VRAHTATCSSQMLRKSWRLRFDRSTRKTVCWPQIRTVTELLFPSGHARPLPQSLRIESRISLIAGQQIRENIALRQQLLAPHATRSGAMRIAFLSGRLDGLLGMDKVVFTLPSSFQTQASPLLCVGSLVQIVLGTWRRCSGKRRQGKFSICLSGEKSEECHAKKISNPVCR